MGSIAPQTFYVYFLARPDGPPFYVGKGIGRRMYDHDAEARAGHHCHKCNTIRKIWQSAGEVQRIVVFTTFDEQEALDEEMRLIAFYGRANLTNQTDGGEGKTGYVPSPVTREKLRARMLGNQYARGYVMSDEAREKIRAGHLGVKRSAAFIAKASLRMKGTRQTEESKAKIGAKARGRVYTDEQRIAKSVAMRRSWARRRGQNNDD